MAREAAGSLASLRVTQIGKGWGKVHRHIHCWFASRHAATMGVGQGIPLGSLLLAVSPQSLRLQGCRGGGGGGGGR